MALVGTGLVILKRTVRMLSTMLRPLSATCPVNDSLPSSQQKFSSRKHHRSAARSNARNLSTSTLVCRSEPQHTDYRVLSYSSAQPYSPQQLADLREDARDTIVALSSGSGRAGVAVIRVSGPRAGDFRLTSPAVTFTYPASALDAALWHADDILQKVLKPGRSLPQPRTAVSPLPMLFHSSLAMCRQHSASQSIPM